MWPETVATGVQSKAISIHSNKVTTGREIFRVQIESGCIFIMHWFLLSCYALSDLPNVSELCTLCQQKCLQYIDTLGHCIYAMFSLIEHSCIQLIVCIQSHRVSITLFVSWLLCTIKMVLCISTQDV